MAACLVLIGLLVFPTGAAAQVTGTKTVYSTSLSSTTGNDLAIGETVTYQVDITIPDGQVLDWVILGDTLPVGLVALGAGSATIDASPGLTTLMPGGFSGALFGATMSGTSVIVSLSNVQNTDNDPGTTQKITIRYSAVATNVAGNQAGTSLGGTTTVSTDQGNQSVTSPQMRIVEPQVSVVLELADPLQTTFQAGDQIEYRMTILAESAPTRSTAYDFQINLPIPAGVVSGPALPMNGGAYPTTSNSTNQLISLTYAEVPRGSTIALQFWVTITNAVGAGATLTSTVTHTYSSLPGDGATPQVPGNNATVERNGSGGLNDYTGTDSDVITTHSSSISGYVYVDTNGSGFYNYMTDPGVRDTVMTLTGTDHTGATVSLSTTAANDGSYSFSALRGGTYVLTQPVQPPMYLTGPEHAGNPTNGSLSPNGNQITNIVLPSSASTAAVGYDFGELPDVDLSLTLAASREAVRPGDAVEFTAAVKNPSFSHQVNEPVVTIILPKGLTYTGVVNPSNWTCTEVATGVLRCTNYPMPPTYTGTLAFTTQVAASVVDHSQLRTVASATSTRIGDWDSRNNTAVATMVVAKAGEVDLGVTLTAPAQIGDASVGQSFTATVTNHGTTAADPTLTIMATSSGVTFLGYTAAPAGTSCEIADSIVCALPTLAPGESGSFVFTAQGDMGRRTLLASVEGPVGIADPNPDNGAVSLGTTWGDSTRAELLLTVTAPQTAVIGQRLWVKYVVKNVGLAPAHDTTVQSVGMTNAVTSIPGFPACPMPCVVGTLNPNETHAFYELYEVPGGLTPTQVTLTRAVTSSTTDAYTSNNSATVMVRLIDAGRPDLTTMLFDSPEPVVSGQPLELVALVTNEGPISASTTQVTLAAPDGFAATPVSRYASTGTCTGPSCAFSSLGAGQTALFAFSVDTPSGIPSANPATSSVTVSPTIQIDANPASNSATQASTLMQQADLQITKTITGSVVAGMPFVYSITVTNNGPSAAASVVASDTAAAGTTFVSNAGDCTTAFGCALGTLAPGASKTITSTYTLAANYTTPATFSAAATVSSDATDPISSNDSSAPIATVEFSADLSIDVTGPASVSPGETAAYTVTVTNNGPSDAAGVSVSNATPAGLTLSTVSSPCVGPTFLPCSLGTIASGQTASITVTFAVPSGYSGASPIVNVASVSGTHGDANNANDSDSASTTVTPRADLGVTMTGPATTQTDTNVTFTITVTNNGPSDVSDATISVPTPPPGLTFVSEPGGCASFPCNIGAIASGGTKTVTATYNVPYGYTTPDPIVHTVSVSSSAADTNTLNDAASASIAASTDLAITVADAPDPATAGADLVYTITVTNNGPTEAFDVSVADTLPAGTTFVSATTSAGGGCTAPTVGSTGAISCTWGGSTPVSATRTVTLTVHVDPTATHGTIISNTATVISHTNESAPANNSATETTTVETSTDIAVSMTVDNAFVNLGEEAVFTVTVRNLGPSRATGIAITDALPLGLTHLDTTLSQGSYNAVSGLWIVGVLELNGSATMQLRVRAEESGSRLNTAIKTAGDQPDPNTANNSAAVSLTSQPTADVSVSKTVNVSSANVGDTVRFTITAGNAGPNDATAVRIVDALPPGLTYVSSQASTGAFDPGGLWQISTLAKDAQATLTIDAIVNDAGAILNTASKTGQGEDDPNPANDSSGATVNGLSADIQVVTTLATNTEAQIGGEVTFFVTTTNNGPSAATGVRVRDLLPPGLALVGASATRGIYVPATGAWEIGDLAATGPEGTAVLELRGMLLSLDGLTNEARVLASDQLDPVPSNNVSVVAPQTRSSDLVFDIAPNGDPGQAHSTVDYTFEVRNDGSGPTGSPLTVAIPLPPEYEYVSVQQAGVRATGAATGTATGTATAPAAAWSCTPVRRTVFCRSESALVQGDTANLVVRLQIVSWLAQDRVLFAYLATPGGERVPVRLQQYSLAATDTEADLSVTQTLRIENGIGPLRSLKYFIDVTNNGPREATEVTLTDVLPPNATYTWANTPYGVCGRTDGFIACDLRTIAPGATVRAMVNFSVDAPDGVVHAVGVSSGTYDPSLQNNTHVLTTRLDAPDFTDSDGDRMTDGWESLTGLSVTTDDAAGDADGDGVSNLDEYYRGTHPRGTESRYFAEGAANSFFQTTIAVLNPDTAASASVMVELLLEDGTIRSVPFLLAPLGRVEVDPLTLMPDGGAFSVQVESDRPVAVDRDMRWDGTGYGSSGESGAVETSTTWYFAEGATNPYSLFYLVENPSMTETAQLQMSFLLPGGAPPVVVPESVAPHSRKTIVVNDLADRYPVLRTAEVAATFTSTNSVPIVVERAMYLNLPNQPMGAGHAGLGATSPSASWFFAEGATGGFFKEFILLANPQSTPAEARVRYLLPDGSSLEIPYGLDPLSRRTIDVAGEDARLAATPVSAVVTATQPIVAERVMWWPNAPTSPYWYEAHVSLGATSTGTVWAIAGAAAGGRWAEQTYALLANQESYAGEARVTVTLDSGEQATRLFPLAATSRQTVDFAAEFPLVRGQHFSALIESIGTTPAPIAVEWSRYGSSGGQLWTSGSAALATKVR